MGKSRHLVPHSHRVLIPVPGGAASNPQSPLIPRLHWASTSRDHDSPGSSVVTDLSSVLCLIPNWPELYVHNLSPFGRQRSAGPIFARHHLFFLSCTSFYFSLLIYILSKTEWYFENSWHFLSQSTQRFPLIPFATFWAILNFPPLKNRLILLDYVKFQLCCTPHTHTHTGLPLHSIVFSLQKVNEISPEQLKPLRLIFTK